MQIKNRGYADWNVYTIAYKIAYMIDVLPI